MVKENRFARDAVQTASLSFSIIPPPDDLKHLVQYFWAIEMLESNTSRVIRTFSDDSSGLIFHHTFDKGTVRPSGKNLPPSFVYGVPLTPTVTEITAPFSAVGVLFHAHSLRSALDVDAHYLTDRVFSLSEFDKRFALDEMMYGMYSQEERITLLSEFLRRNAGKKYAPDPLVVGAIELIKTGGFGMNVRNITDYFKVSERQLQRRFMASAGVSPRHYLQTVKFQHVVRYIRSQNFKNLGDIAYNLEFADQAHFNRLVRKFAGLAPGEIIRLIQYDIINLLME